METFEAVLAPRIILSDRVIREEGTQKLSLIGCFDAFFSQMFPFQAFPFFVTVAITNIVGFPEQLNVVVRIESPTTGHVIASSATTATKAPGAAPPPRNAVIELTVPFVNVRFDTAGTYSVVCLVSNEILGSRRFEVMPATAVPPNQQQ